MRTPEEIAAAHGAVIYQDDYRVVRAKLTLDNGELSITVNPKRNGKEHLPLAYFLGSNALIHEYKGGDR